ncbi:hypothetical protein Ahy_A04g021610 isoform B [Arachis hypogaea]|uniref:Uncharacterized protein n=1 Tax=Arachis hypogaea TaxID=3818 RepID=A0A445DLE4_ARAHY|nr:hypothetical protein Ahy_A04g021610 isoform B [Arachis hypogaea]
MVTGFEDVLVLDEKQVDDDDDGGNGVGVWLEVGPIRVGVVVAPVREELGSGGGNTRWGGAGGSVGPRGEGAWGLNLVVVPRVGGGSSQVEASTLFLDFGSLRQMRQVFGAGSDFFAEIAQFVSPGGDYRT